MLRHRTRIFVVKFQYESSEVVVFVKRVCKFLAYKRQLETDKIVVACLQILQQCRHGEARYVVHFAIAVDGEVDYGEKRIGVHILVVAYLLNRLVAKAETDTEAT